MPTRRRQTDRQPSVAAGRARRCALPARCEPGPSARAVTTGEIAITVHTGGAMRLCFVAAACTLALMSAAASAEIMPLADAAKLFGTRESAWGAELSPSGKQMLFLA